MPEGRCVYCLDPKVSVSICLQCRSKLEQAERDVQYLQRQIAYYRRSWFNIDKDNRRLKEALAKAKKK